MDSSTRLSDFDWVNPDPIAEGGFGTVFHACYKGRDVALKRFSKRGHDTDEQSRHRVLNEIAVHMEMDHECVAKVVPPGFFECDETNALYLVTEFCSNGTLMDYVKRSRLSGEGKPSGLPESVAQRFFRQLAEGVAYLHTQGVIHRDIKLKNLLLTADMQLKLTDFGVAVWTSGDDGERYSVCGTPATAAPEIAPGRSHAASCDIWSMGCVLFAMLTGQSAVVKTTLDEHRSLRPDFTDMLSSLHPAAQQLLRQMLQLDPDARPTAEEVLKSPWCRVCLDGSSSPLRVEVAVQPPPAASSPHYACHLAGVSASTASSATIASNSAVSMDPVEDVLFRIRQDRLAARKQARVQAREGRRAMRSGTGQDGHQGAGTVLDVYVSGADDVTAGVLSPGRSQRSHSSSFSHELSASLPSLASSLSVTSRSNPTRTLRSVSWSGRELAYRFGHVTSKAALFVMNHVLVAAAADSGRCIQLVCDMESKVWVGNLAARSGFPDFAALCGRLSPTVTFDELDVWVAHVQAWCGVTVHSSAVSCVPAKGTHVSWALGRPVPVARLRSRERQVYRWASHVMNTLCASVPKRTLVLGDAVCTVMDNYPLPDFRYATTSGRCVVHISTREDTAVIVDNSTSPPTAVHTRATGFTGHSGQLPPEYSAVLTDAQVALAQCLLQSTRAARPPASPP